jgi:hypothetical protein
MVSLAIEEVIPPDIERLGDAFDTMLKNNQEQSTSGHVLCRHCGAVLFCKKYSPSEGIWNFMRKFCAET